MQACLKMFQQNKIKIRVGGVENRQNKNGRLLIIIERESRYIGVYYILLPTLGYIYHFHNKKKFVYMCVCVYLFPTQYEYTVILCEIKYFCLNCFSTTGNKTKTNILIQSWRVLKMNLRVPWEKFPLNLSE